MNILIVDDNAQNLELLQAYLEDLNCPIRLRTTASRPSPPSTPAAPTSSFWMS